MESGTFRLSNGFHAAIDATIATVAGLIAVLIFFPILILTTAVKVPLKVFRRVRNSRAGDAHRASRLNQKVEPPSGEVGQKRAA